MMSCRGGPAKTCASKNVRFRERERVRSGSESSERYRFCQWRCSINCCEGRRCDNSDVCFEDKLEGAPFLGGSTVRSRSAQQSAILHCCSRSSSHTSRSPTSQLCKDGQQGSNCQLPTMCKDVKCDDGQGESFLEPLKQVASSASRSTNRQRVNNTKLRTDAQLRTEGKTRAPRAQTAPNARDTPKREGHRAKCAGLGTPTNQNTKRVSTVHA